MNKNCSLIKLHVLIALTSIALQYSCKDSNTNTEEDSNNIANCTPPETNMDTKNQLLGVWKQIEPYPDGTYWQLNFFISEPEWDKKEFTLFKFNSSGNAIEDFYNDKATWIVEEPGKVKSAYSFRSLVYSIKFIQCNRITTGNAVFEKVIK